jgi:hypothetical protein
MRIENTIFWGNETGSDVFRKPARGDLRGLSQLLSFFLFRLDKRREAGRSGFGVAAADTGGERSKKKHRMPRATASAPGPPPPSRWTRLLGRYAAALDEQAARDPAAHERLRLSTSLDTDGHAERLLAAAGASERAVADDAWYAARRVWTTAMAALPREAAPPALAPLRHTDTLLRRLMRQQNAYGTADDDDDDDARGRGRSAIFTDVYRLKEAYVAAHHADAWSVRGLAQCCAVLHCGRPGDAFRLNGMGYCARHRGLALFNGLRHTRWCDACRVWNALGLKGTLGDPGHVRAAVIGLTVPWSDRAVGPRNVAVRYFCPPGGDRDAERLDRWTYAGPAPQSYTDAQGRRRLTPPHAWVLGGRPRVRAWLQATRTDVRTGAAVPIVDRAELAAALRGAAADGHPSVLARCGAAAGGWNNEPDW